MSYDFPGRSTVWLQGIGSLPPKGNLSYIVQGKRVVFRTAKGSTLLASLGVIPTYVAQLPEAGSLFPPPTTYGNTWVHDLPNLEMPLTVPQATSFVMDLLGKPGNPQRFSFTPCRPDDEGCILSQWTTITNPGEHIQAQFSVMLTYAQDKSKGKGVTVVKVFYIGRQAYQGGSEWSSSLNDHIRSLLLDRVTNMRTSLSNLPKGGDQ
jgi:hypothetical protein